MKTSLLLIAFMAITVSLSYGQGLSKAEKKALQKEIKELQKNPAKYKQMKDGVQEKKDHLTKLDGQIDDLNESINGTQEKLKEKDTRIKELSDEIARLRTEKEETDKVVKTNTNGEGLIYKVQVQIDDSSLYQEVSEIDGKSRPIFSGEQDEDGTKKYTFGYFKDKAEAETFRKYLQMLRIRDAVVVAYKDGKKIQ
jgi:TolA-binding protein